MVKTRVYNISTLEHNSITIHESMCIKTHVNMKCENDWEKHKEGKAIVDAKAPKRGESNRDVSH